MKIKDIATLRARAGYILSDDTLYYATGGAACVRTTFGGEVGDPNDPDRPSSTIPNGRWPELQLRRLVLILL